MISAIVLSAAVAIELVCAIAIVRMRRTYDQIHFASLGAIAGLLLVAAAIAPALTLTSGLKLGFVVVFGIAANAVTSHILGLAVHRSKEEE